MYPISVNYEIVDRPARQVVELSDMKCFINVDFDDDDELISALMDTAVEIVEKHLNRPLLQRTVRANLQHVQYSNIEQCGFLSWQLANVMSVTLLERWNGTEFVSVATDQYDVKLTPGYARILLRRFGFLSAVSLSFDCEPYLYRVTFKAGYGRPTDIPAPIITAIKTIVNQLYVDRGDCGDEQDMLNPTARMLLKKYIVRGVFA